MSADYKTTFESLDLDQVTLQIGHGETITPTISSDSRVMPSPMETLPPFQVDSSKESLSDFRIVGPLGEGGMGVVSLAEQRALRRLVAVKEPKQGDKSAYGRVLLEKAHFKFGQQADYCLFCFRLGRDIIGAFFRGRS